MVNTPPNIGLAADGAREALNRRARDLADRLQGIGRSRPFVAFVALAAIIFGLYYFVIAAPIYVSDTSFTLRGREQPSALGGGAAGLLAAVGGGGGAGGANENAEVSEYILSYEMLEKLDRKLHLRELYSRPRLDVFNWLRAGAPKEEFLHFYRRMVKVSSAQGSGILSVQVRSFDPASAKAIAEQILVNSAEYVDGLSEVVRKDTVKASLADLQQAEQAVRQTRLAMAQYRNTTGLLDPTLSAAASSGTIQSLTSEILSTRAQLATLETYSRPNNPQVVQLRARIAALQKQIADEQNHLATTKSQDTLSEQLYKYEGLKVANEYAEKQLLAALSAYDSARAVASQRERYLVRVINPHLPDKPTLPNRLLSFIEAMVVVIAGYGIIALVIAGVRDHQGI
jgi:BexC/CtrB/KpsE family polysaccharide export inner-membrane protein